MRQPQRLRLAQPLPRLTRCTMPERLDRLRQAASPPEWPAADCRERLLADEGAATPDQPVTRRTAMARFPARTTGARGDVGVQPARDRNNSHDLAPWRFLDQGDKGVLRGPPGTGKPPLALARGRKASPPGERALCPSAMRRIATRTHASAENRRQERLQPYALPTRRIIDASGDSPMDQHGAPLCCPLLSRREARGAMILPAHHRCGPGGAGVGNPLIATAIVDRWRPHRGVMTITGDSSRLRDHQQAGWRRQPEPPSAS